MKIGVITCWQPDDNYGTQIQCFALLKYLEKIGHEPFLIKYHRFEDINRTITLAKLLKALNPYKLTNWFIRRVQSKKSASESLLHNRNAPDFRKKYLMLSKDYYNYKELKKDPPKADCYIVGSDQVWNIYYSQVNNINAHFLNFGDKETLRFSYASSFGFSKNKLMKKYSKVVIPLLKRFNYISVREESGLDILKEMGLNNAQQVCDPTMLLSASDYISYFNDENIAINTKKYIFVYELNADSNLDLNEIKKWAINKSLDIIYVRAHGKISDFQASYLSVPEWVMAIKNAEYVITNSFHGTVFSCLFNRPVALYPLKGMASTTNTRISVITKLLEKNIVINDSNNFSNILESDFDWSVYKKNLEIFRDIGVSYLNKSLDTQSFEVINEN